MSKAEESTTTAPEESPPKKKASGNLGLRVLTAAIGIPIVLWMLFGLDPLYFSLFGLVAAVVGGSEMAGMTLSGQRPLQAWMVIATVGVNCVMTFFPTADALLGMIFALFVGGPLMMLVRPDPIDKAARAMGWLIAGPLYVGGALSAIAKLHHLDDNGGLWVVLAMGLAWFSDTGGYFAGRAFGKHKLYEKISPKKTIEGSIGGLATIVVFALVVSFLWLPGLSPLHAVLLALVAGAAGQAGDLCISVIKRSTGVKDSGFIMPGHGGLLDRIDALMFTASGTLVYTTWVLGLDATVPVFPGL